MADERDRAADEPAQERPNGAAQETARKRPGFIARWCRRGFVLACATLILLALLPTILSHTPLGDRAVAMISRHLPPRSSIGRIRFSWLDPVAICDVRHAPAAGHDVKIEVIETSQSFLQLLAQRDMPDELLLSGVHYRIDLDKPAAADSEGNSPGGDSPSEPKGVLRLPKLALSNLRVSVANGPFRQPIELTFPAVAIQQDALSRQLAVTGEGALLAGEAAAPLRVTAEVHPAGELRRVGLTATGVDVSELLKLLKAPPFFGQGDLKVQLLVTADQPGGAVTTKLTAESPALQLAALEKRASASTGVTDSPSSTMIPIENLLVRAAAVYQPDTGEFVVEPASVESNLLSGSITCRGTVPEDTSADEIAADFSGELNLLGPAVELAGLPPEVELSNIRFAPLAGQYRPEGLSLNGRLSWDNAAAFGLASAAGRVDYELTPTQLQISMSDVPVGDGQARGVYRLDVESTPAVLSFDGGPALEGVTITETMCREWLKYVSPTFASATDIRGRLGLNLEPVNAPLSDGIVPDLTGQLVIDGATMRPGPVGRDLVGTIGELGSAFGSGRLRETLGDGRGLELVELPPQRVDFAVRGGNVYHRGFTMRSGRVFIQTGGAVGLDNRLDLAAQLTVDPESLRDRPILAGIFQQPIELPITGTIESPKIDRAAMKNFGRDAAAGAVGGLLQRLLDR